MKTFKRKTLSLDGKGKLLIAAGIIFLSKKMLISPVLEPWVPRRTVHRPSDLVWKNKWARLSEMSWGVTPPGPLPASPGLGGHDKWLLTGVFQRHLSSMPKISHLIWLFAVILTWKERFGKSRFQNTANRELLRVTGQPFNPPGNIPETQLE